MCSVHLVAPQYYVQYWVEYVNIQDVFSLLHALCLSTLHISQYGGVLEQIKSTFNVFSNLSGTTVCAMLSRVCEYTGRSLVPLCPVFVHITYLLHDMHVCEPDLLENVPYRLHCGQFHQKLSKN